MNATFSHIGAQMVFRCGNIFEFPIKVLVPNLSAHRVTVSEVPMYLDVGEGKNFFVTCTGTPASGLHEEISILFVFRDFKTEEIVGEICLPVHIYAKAATQISEKIMLHLIWSISAVCAFFFLECLFLTCLTVRGL